MPTTEEFLTDLEQLIQKYDAWFEGSPDGDVAVIFGQSRLPKIESLVAVLSARIWGPRTP